MAGTVTAREVFPGLVACAARLLGSERALARYLGVGLREVEQWIEGRGIPPAELFPRLSALLARDIPKIAQSKFRLAAGDAPRA